MGHRAAACDARARRWQGVARAVGHWARNEPLTGSACADAKPPAGAVRSDACARFFCPVQPQLLFGRRTGSSDSERVQLSLQGEQGWKEGGCMQQALPCPDVLHRRRHACLVAVA